MHWRSISRENLLPHSCSEIESSSSFYLNLSITRGNSKRPKKGHRIIHIYTVRWSVCYLPGWGLFAKLHTNKARRWSIWCGVGLSRLWMKCWPYWSFMTCGWRQVNIHDKSQERRPHWATPSLPTILVQKRHCSNRLRYIVSFTYWAYFCTSNHWNHCHYRRSYLPTIKYGRWCSSRLGHKCLRCVLYVE